MQKQAKLYAQKTIATLKGGDAIASVAAKDSLHARR
jgi:hypothetical protein